MIVSICGPVLFLSVLSTSFGLTVNLRHDDIDWMDVKHKAIWVGSLLQANKGLVREVPKISKLIQDVANGATAINPAMAATTIYFVGVLIALHHYSTEAKRQLREVEFLQEDIEMIISTEIIPNIQNLEEILSKGNLEGFCKENVQKHFKDKLGQTDKSLQGLREKIGLKMDEASSSASMNGLLQWGTTAAGGVIGIGAAGAAIAVGPCIATAFLACPQTIMGVTSIASAATSAAGYYGFGINKRTHEETFKILNETKKEVYEWQKTYKLAQNQIEAICLYYDLNLADVNGIMQSLDTIVMNRKLIKSDE